MLECQTTVLSNMKTPQCPILIRLCCLNRALLTENDQKQVTQNENSIVVFSYYYGPQGGKPPRSRIFFLSSQQTYITLICLLIGDIVACENKGLLWHVLKGVGQLYENFDRRVNQVFNFMETFVCDPSMCAHANLTTLYIFKTITFYSSIHYSLFSTFYFFTISIGNFMFLSCIIYIKIMNRVNFFLVHDFWGF